jgi:hypothetical protein
VGLFDILRKSQTCRKQQRTKDINSVFHY